MGLKCPDCGSRNTRIVDSEDFERIGNEPLVSNALVAAIGVNWKEKIKETKFFICEDCGYWKELEIKKEKETSVSIDITDLIPILKFFILY